ncbi:M1 family metallopeptidase [Haloimpatiens sp. FM7330]|uniref:M1 family metallopeptidase n=1 Tax=Haloimpatiens sp. FM7330 TaxID=3298610 RepID=UPI0036403431
MSNKIIKNKTLKKIICIVSITLVCIFIKTPTIFAQEGRNDYIINATFNEKQKVLTASEKVVFKNTYGCDLKNIVFHLYPDAYGKASTKPQIGNQPNKLKPEEIGDINITKVLLNDEKVEFTQDNQILKIKLDKELKKGEQVNIWIESTLKFPQGYDRMGYVNDIYSFTNWYPILSVYDEKTNKWDENPFNPIGESNYAQSSNYDVTLNVPKDMKVASTGIEQKSSIISNDKVLNIKAQNVRDFVFIMSPKFKVISKNVDGIKVNSFYFDTNNTDKETCKKRANIILDKASDALSFFSEKFGKYPFKEYDVVETNLAGGAMEYPQLIQMGQYNFDTKNLEYNIAERIPFEIEAVVHETCHQWWFSVVGNNEFKESFLDESFTVYSTAYYFEKKYGKYCQSGTLIKFRTEPYNRLKKYPLNTSVDKFKNWQEYSFNIYGRGPLALEDLRQRIGEEKFIKFFQTYFNKYKFKNSTIKGMLDVVESTAGKDIRNIIYNDITNKEYNPKNILISDEERNKINIEMSKAYILKNAKEDELSTASIFAKAILGEKIYIVKPSTLSKEESTVVDQLIKNFRFMCEQEFEVKNNIIVKTDKEISNSELKNNNVIIMGNYLNNKVYNSLNEELPIVLGNKFININGTSINSSNIHGNFLVKNPYNKDKYSLFIFWNSKLVLNEINDYRINGYDNYQFDIKIDNNKEFKGKI